jgi:hypothetical protein
LQRRVEWYEFTTVPEVLTAYVITARVGNVGKLIAFYTTLQSR